MVCSSRISLELFRILAVNSNELMLASLDEFLNEIETSPLGLEIFYQFSQISALKDEFALWYKTQQRITATTNSLSSTEFELMKDKLTYEKGGGFCYNNSQRVAFIDHTSFYVEGFINTSANPSYKLITQHAFNCSEAKKVKDFTLKPILEVTPNYYYGIVIPLEIIIILLEKIGLTSEEIFSSKITLSFTIPFFLLSTNRIDMIDKKFYCPASQIP